MKARLILYPLVAVAMFACGGSSFVGTVAGNKLDVKDALFLTYTEGGKITGASIILVDKAMVCDTLKANRNPKSVTGAIFNLGKYNTDGTVLAPDVGEYTVVSGLTTQPTSPVATGGFTKYDANCTNSVPAESAEAKSGIIKLTQFKAETNGSAVGTFDVTFGTDKVTGSFSAIYCAVPQTTATPSCE